MRQKILQTIWRNKLIKTSNFPLGTAHDRYLGWFPNNITAYFIPACCKTVLVLCIIMLYEVFIIFVLYVVVFLKFLPAVNVCRILSLKLL